MTPSPRKSGCVVSYIFYTLVSVCPRREERRELRYAACTMLRNQVSGAFGAEEVRRGEGESRAELIELIESPSRRVLSHIPLVASEGAVE